MLTYADVCGTVRLLTALTKTLEVEVNVFKASLAEDAEAGGAEEPEEHREVCGW
jgi:hypothetical protein